MKTLILTCTATLLTLSSAHAANNLDPYVESALQEICKSASSDNVLRMDRTIKQYQLDHQTVALNVVCNDQDIISFAYDSGARKTANRLQRSIGDTEITDLAMLK
ncbi:DUF3718 domain-containing protein [Thalassotalea mangrovi]|uniref:DUF3718 domain-containing protein n=1 Tax=Thalassotalea mangrovi TaxID=2572245 RepID=A0A4U1B8P7_9GAMM|nr:DUF3718 domain-containing protein [Thalassotalea mangrovi]TKB46895.1 DUF3718 domain-containing protein [Thalassotalea mangrovi]